MNINWSTRPVPEVQYGIPRYYAVAAALRLNAGMSYCAESCDFDAMMNWIRSIGEKWPDVGPLMVVQVSNAGMAVVFGAPATPVVERSIQGWGEF